MNMKKQVIHKRVSGRILQRIRKRMMQDQPLCRMCEVNGLVVLGAEMDHILPIFKGGSNDDENLQMLCVACHLKKTADDLGVTYRPVTGQDGWPIEKKECATGRAVENLNIK